MRLHVFLSHVDATKARNRKRKIYCERRQKGKCSAKILINFWAFLSPPVWRSFSNQNECCCLSQKTLKPDKKHEMNSNNFFSLLLSVNRFSELRKSFFFQRLSISVCDKTFFILSISITVFWGKMKIVLHIFSLLLGEKVSIWKLRIFWGALFNYFPP